MKRFALIAILFCTPASADWSSVTVQVQTTVSGHGYSSSASAEANEIYRQRFWKLGFARRAAVRRAIQRAAASSETAAHEGHAAAMAAQKPQEKE